MRLLLLLILRRLALGVVTLWVVSIIVFAATQALPTDPARAILGREATPQSLKTLRHQLHLDRPLTEQYWTWFSGVLRGDLGTSLSQRSSSYQGGEASQENTPVTAVIGRRLANSGILVCLAALVSVPAALLLGAFAAFRRDKAFDVVTSSATLALAALPEFVLGISVILLFATGVFHILPAVSVGSPATPAWQQGKILVLPVLTLALAVTPYIARMMRASTIEVLESDYMAMARLKGLKARHVLLRHAFPNAVVPAIQGTAIQLAWLAGGIVVVEYLFGYQGIGSALVDAVANRDLPVIQALTLIIAAVYVVTNLLADVVTILVSPRLRTGQR